MHDIFTELSLIIIVTAAVSLIMKLLRQPLILGYILSGLLVGPSGLKIIHSPETFEVFATLGIALLLFIIGLGMNVTELRKLGRVALYIATATLVTVSLTGFAVSSLLGFSRSEAIVMGLALFFSSTIIIVKLLSDKKEQNRLHGQIAIGVILIDDLVATFALLFLAARQDGGLTVGDVGLLVAKGLLLIIGLIVANTKLLPRVTHLIASSQELLFLFAISWGFGIASLFKAAGFSIEVGALFAGVALASSPYAQEIGSRLKPLRDFFVVLFFIALGESMTLSNLSNSIGPAAVLAAIVIILKPLVVTTTTGLLGYAKRISFKAGINLSQISEFSIIFSVLAVSTGVAGERVSAVITLVAIITIAVSAYLIQYDDKLYPFFDRIKIHMFEKEVSYKERRNRSKNEIILFGYHNGGHVFIDTFEQMKKRFLVIDYNPNVIDILERQGVPYVYGDASDPELLEELGIQSTKLVISTFTDFAASQQLARNVSKINPATIIICNANNHEEALKLYEAGCTYVVIPHHAGNTKVSAFLKKSGLEKVEFEQFREKHKTFIYDYLQQSGHQSE